MNTNDMLAILAELFDSFSFHELFLEELGSLLKKDLKGKENRFFKMLSTQLNHIRTFGRAIYTVDGHEILQVRVDITIPYTCNSPSSMSGYWFISVMMTRPILMCI